MENMGSEIDPSDSETSLRPSRHVWAYGWHFLDSQLLQKVLMECIACLQLPPSSLPPTHFLIRATRDITVAVKRVA